MRTTEEIRERKTTVSLYLIDDQVNISLLMKRLLRPYEEQVSSYEYDPLVEGEDRVDEFVHECLEKFVDLLEKEEVLFNNEILENLRSLFDLDNNFSDLENLND